MTLNPTRPAYVPPHLRNRDPAAAPPATKADLRGPAPHMNGNGYAHSPNGLPTPAPTPPGTRGVYSAPRPSDDGGWGAPRAAPAGRTMGGGGGAPPGYGSWRGGQHIVGARNQRMEHELFGEEGDGVHQVS